MINDYYHWLLLLEAIIFTQPIAYSSTQILLKFKLKIITKYMDMLSATNNDFNGIVMIWIKTYHRFTNPNPHTSVMVNIIIEKTRHKLRGKVNPSDNSTDEKIIDKINKSLFLIKIAMTKMLLLIRCVQFWRSFG